MYDRDKRYQRRDPPTPCEVLHDDGRWYPGVILAVHRHDGRWCAMTNYQTRDRFGCVQNRGGGFFEDRVRRVNPPAEETN